MGRRVGAELTTLRGIVHRYKVQRRTYAYVRHDIAGIGKAGMSKADLHVITVKVGGATCEEGAGTQIQTQTRTRHSEAGLCLINAN